MSAIDQLTTLKIPSHQDAVTRQVAGVLQQARALIAQGSEPLRPLDVAGNKRTREVTIKGFSYTEYYYTPENDFYEIIFRAGSEVLWIGTGRRTFEEDILISDKNLVIRFLDEARAKNTDPNSFTGSQRYQSKDYALLYESTQEGDLDNFTATTFVYYGNGVCFKEEFFGRTISGQPTMSDNVWTEQISTLTTTLDGRITEMNLALEVLTSESSLLDVLDALRPLSPIAIKDLVTNEFDIALSAYILDNLNYPKLLAISAVYSALNKTINSLTDRSTVNLDYVRIKREFDRIDPAFTREKDARRITETYAQAKEAYENILSQSISGPQLNRAQDLISYHISEYIDQVPIETRPEFLEEAGKIAQHIYALLNPEA